MAVKGKKLVKRGRPAKVKAEEPKAKKRGRPAKVKEEPKTKKRGRPAKAKVEEPKAKKRGRPAKVKEEPKTKKRGRKVEEEPEDEDIDDEDVDEDDLEGDDEDVDEDDLEGDDEDVDEDEEPSPRGRKSKAASSVVDELEDALGEAWVEGIQPISDAFDDWDDKYAKKKLSDGEAIALAEKILKTIKDGCKKVVDILE